MDRHAVGVRCCSIGYSIPERTGTSDSGRGIDYPERRHSGEVRNRFPEHDDTRHQRLAVASSLVTRVEQRSQRVEAPMSMFDDQNRQAQPERRDSVSSSDLVRGPDLRTVVAALSAGLVDPTPEGGLSGIFERQLQQILSIRGVRLREVPTRYQARLVTPTRTSESIVLGVPTADPQVQAVLEATFERNRHLDEHDVELLTVAAQLGGLVLEASRGRTVFRTHRVPGAASPLIGSTAAMQLLRERVERVAQTDFTVLIEGESGTGKELVARQLHEMSRRRAGPFVAVNCAAVVETLLEAELFGIEERTATGVRGRRGKFEHADGGTLFLDEVSDLALSAQAKLLRAIQDLAVERVGSTGTRRVDTRIVVATNRPLSELVEQGLFRAGSLLPSQRRGPSRPTPSTAV